MKKLLIGVGLACGLMLLCNINAFAYDENSDIIEQGNGYTLRMALFSMITLA